MPESARMHERGSEQARVIVVGLVRNHREELLITPEFTEYAWVKPNAVLSYDLNSAIVEMLRRVGVFEI